MKPIISQMAPTSERAESDSATKAVVNDAMRTDVLGPNVCKVLNEHVPTNDLLEEKLVKLISNSSGVKEAVGAVVSDNQSVRLGRWLERVALVVGGFLISLAGEFLIAKITKG